MALAKALSPPGSAISGHAADGIAVLTKEMTADQITSAQQQVAIWAKQH
jgi:hypothetical protein